jgi:hypothetical protein
MVWLVLSSFVPVATHPAGVHVERNAHHVWVGPAPLIGSAGVPSRWPPPGRNRTGMCRPGPDRPAGARSSGCPPG